MPDKKVVTNANNENETEYDENVVDAVSIDALLKENQMNDDDIEDENLPTDDEIDEILNFDNQPEVEEAHGLSYTNRRNMTGREGGLDYNYLSAGEQDQSPDYIKESKAKFKALIKENKSLTSKIKPAGIFNKLSSTGFFPVVGLILFVFRIIFPIECTDPSAMSIPVFVVLVTTSEVLFITAPVVSLTLNKNPLT
jgi:hypothetical protein